MVSKVADEGNRVEPSKYTKRSKTMHLHIGHHNIDGLKDVLHMAIFFIVLLKIHVIDRQLSLLEKRATNK